MMTLRKKPALKEEIQQEKTSYEKLADHVLDTSIDATDAFFEMIDGVSERQNSYVSDMIKLTLGITLVNLEFAADMNTLLVGKNDK